MQQFLRYVGIPAVLGAVIGLTALWLADGAGQPSAATAGFADAVDRAAPAVVSIHSTTIVPNSQHPICRLPRFRDMCEARGNVQTSLGSGVVVRDDGYILTNAHVIPTDAEQIEVVFNSGQRAKAELVGTDPETDLAVIKIDANGLVAIDIASSSNARVGDVVLAIGNPFGIGQTVSLGIVSAKGRYFTSSPYDDFIQTDAAVNPGNSGGALINTQGALLGINTMILEQGAATSGFSQGPRAEGIGFAIPSNLATMVLDEIVEHGQVRRGYLGVVLNPSQRGLIVDRVLPNGPADQAGIRVGDEILSIDKLPATTSRAATRQVAMKEPGAVFEISLVRNGREVSLDVTAGLRPPAG